MEATCRLAMTMWETDDLAYAKVCGAPIPRHETGQCEHCGEPRAYHQNPRRVNACAAYLGPLASECTRGHPVAVPSEAERQTR